MICQQCRGNEVTMRKMTLHMLNCEHHVSTPNTYEDTELDFNVLEGELEEEGYDGP